MGCVPLCIFLAVVCASGQRDQPTPSPRQDVLGWKDARWGMTADDLIRTFGQALQKLPHRTRYKNAFVEYVIPHVTLNQASFTVHFQMDTDTHHLNHIFMRLNTTASSAPSDDAFFGCEQLLIQQYGTPHAHKDVLRLEYLSRSRQWLFPTTIIELSYAKIRPFSSLTITYSPASR